MYIEAIMIASIEDELADIYDDYELLLLNPFLTPEIFLPIINSSINAYNLRHNLQNNNCDFLNKRLLP